MSMSAFCHIETVPEHPTVLYPSLDRLGLAAFLQTNVPRVRR